VILVDANVLIYAVNEDSPQHDEARSWLEGVLDSNETVGLAWIVILAFIRLITNDRIFPSPMTTDSAFDMVDAWLNHPNVVIPSPDVVHATALRDLLARTGSAANLVNDAHLAVLALAHGATVASYDGDFNRFGVAWTTPAP
jgi:toxin-antitoxin system PIN domain toxin